MGSVQFIISILTLVICALGLLGNVLCIVVLSHKEMKSPYIYNLLGLSYSDILVLSLGILRTLDNMGVYHIGTPAIGLVIFFWDWICTAGTKYYTVAVSIERFFVVTYPIKAHQWLTVKRAKRCALAVLIFVVALSIFSYIYENYISRSSFQIYVTVILHFVPFVLVVIFNIFIFRGLRSYRKRRMALSNREESEESVTKMLFAIVTMFGFCYSFEVVRLLMNFIWKDYMTAYSHYDYPINYLADIFYVLNSSANFVIYCLLGTGFRNVFCKVFGLSGSDPSLLKSSKDLESSGTVEGNLSKLGEDGPEDVNVAGQSVKN